MNIIVVGLGSMGKRRIRILKEFENVSIFGVDSNSSRCIEVKNLYGIDSFGSISEVTSKVGIDCAFVCTSPLSHSSIIFECLANGINVFTEINLVKDGYVENLKLANEKGLVLFLSSTTLYQSEMKAVIERVKSSKSRLNYMFHVGQYLPDWHPWENYNNYFVGNPRTNGCREIFAIELPWLVTAFGDVETIYSMHGKNTKLNINYDDNYIVSMKHTSGTKGVFVVDVVARKPIRHLEIFGEDLQISWDGTTESLMEYDIRNKIDKKIRFCDIPEHIEGYAPFITENPYKAEVESFMKQVRERKLKAVWGFEEDMKILDVIDEIEK